ncbi:MAG: transcriptional regulator, partial [Candidatus Binatia bacterium]
TKGLAYLAELLRHPGRELFVLDLARVGAAHVRGDARGLAAGLAISGDPGDAGPLLDCQAKAEYRRRLEELREELDDAERSSDAARAAKAREEIGFLTHELLRATGLGGRDRKAASAVERARQSVTIAIRTALRTISENHSALGRHLASTVKTGRFCTYAPDPRSALSWTI